MPEDPAKRAAGEAAAMLVQDGMRVGLGTGSTAFFVVAALGRRVAEDGLRITGVPTSNATAAQASDLGIPLSDPTGQKLDLAIDGADEIEAGTLRLIKGLGGALLREKIVAQLARRFVIIGDESKVVRRLGDRAPLPVEVVRYGQDATAYRIGELGGAPKLRHDKSGDVFITDGGNVIYDCPGFAPIGDPFTLQRDLKAIAGVVETGLFPGPVEQAIIGQSDGSVRVMRG